MNVGAKVREISTGSIGVIEKGNNQNGFFVNFGSRKNWKRYSEVEIIHNTIDNNKAPTTTTTPTNIPNTPNTLKPVQTTQQQPTPTSTFKQPPSQQQTVPIQASKPKVQSEDPGPRFGNFKLPTHNDSTNPKYSTLPSRQFFDVSTSPGESYGTFKRPAAVVNNNNNSNNGNPINGTFGSFKPSSPSRPSIPSFEPPQSKIPTEPNSTQQSPRGPAPSVPKRTTPPQATPTPVPINSQPPPLSKPTPVPVPTNSQPPPLSKPIQPPVPIQQQQINNKPKLTVPPITTVNGNHQNAASIPEKSPRAEQIKDMWNINFNELKFGNVIGSGKYGEVSLGYWLGTPVAIKKLLENNEETDVLIQREIEILKEIRHPQIVQFLGVSRNGEDEIHIITEFMDGGDLFDALIFGDVQLSWREKIRISLDIAMAMRYMQARGILHRDLKSQNVLLSSLNNRAKLCDLGLAKVFKDRINKRFTCVGSDFWMAPEVSLGEVYDYKIDVFSFGIVLVEVITEKIPDERYPQDKFSFNVQKFLQKVPPSCPKEFSQLCIDCTKTNPKDRPSFLKILETIQNIYDNLPEDDEE